MNVLHGAGDIPSAVIAQTRGGTDHMQLKRDIYSGRRKAGGRRPSRRMSKSGKAKRSRTKNRYRGNKTRASRAYRKIYGKTRRRKRRNRRNRFKGGKVAQTAACGSSHRVTVPTVSGTHPSAGNQSTNALSVATNQQLMQSKCNGALDNISGWHLPST